MNAYKCFYETPYGEAVYHFVIAHSATQAVAIFKRFVSKYIDPREWVAPYAVEIRPTHKEHVLGQIYGEYAYYDL